MADRTETLLFLIDVKVNNARALAALDAELDAVMRDRTAELVAAAQTIGVGDRARAIAGAGPARVSGQGELWGARGPIRPGSRENPITQAQESGEAAGLGGLAAAVGDAPRDAPTPGPSTAPIVSPPPEQQKQWLAAAATEVASKVVSPEQDRLIQGLEASARINAASNGGRTGQLNLLGEEMARAVASNGRADQLSMFGLAPASQRRTVTGQSSPAETAAVMLTAAQAASRLGVSRQRIYDIAGSGTLQGAEKTGGAWQIPEQAVIDMLASGGPPGPGGPRVALGGADDRGGGGPGLLARLGWGGGIAGAAGFGSLLSFAGFDFAHVLTTGAGLLGSATAAAGGGGLLALGSLGKLGVGGGSDAAVMSSTIADTKTLYGDITNLNQAIAVYGKNSTQASQAQKQLNYDLQALGPAAQAEYKLAQAAQTLNTAWDQQSAAARQVAVTILAQGVTLGQEFLPLVVNAAQRNLSIINTGLKPLFTWLRGPEGIGIFNDLENAFATELPTAVHAFDQGLELLLRVVDSASSYTGGFVTHLDQLLTRFNSMSNPQLATYIGKFVDDFRIWDTFVKLLIADIYQLFNKDVGTGNAIILSLTGMLQKLHEWETSTTGASQLRNIFQIHKQEILELLQLLPTLASAFTHVYMAVAPAAVGVMNAVVLPVLNGLASVLKAIAASGPAAATALGGFLIAAKFGGVATAVGGLRSLTQWLWGTKAAADAAALSEKKLADATVGDLTAATAATGGGAVAAGGAAAAGSRLALGGSASSATSAVEKAAVPTAAEAADVAGGATFASYTAGLAAAGGRLAAMATQVAEIAGPFAALLAGVNGLADAIGGTGGSGAMGALERFVHGITFGLVPSPENQPQIRAGLRSQYQQYNYFPGLNAYPQISPLNVAIAQKMGVPGSRSSFGGSTAIPADLKQVASIYAELQNLGPSLSPARVEQLYTAVHKLAADPAMGPYLSALKQLAQTIRGMPQFKTAQWQQGFAQAQASMNHWFIDASRGLPALYDDFNTHMRDITHTVGINSSQGAQLVAQNVHKMVTAVTQGMLDGKIKVGAGMQAINSVLKTGVADGAITWQDQWTAMFQTVTDLYQHHKLTTQQYLSDLRQINKQGVDHIKADTEASEDAMYANLKQQQQLGLISQGVFNRKWQQAQQQANAQEQTDMAAFAASIIGPIANVTAQGATGMKDLISSVNSALKLLGAAPLTGLQVSVMSLRGPSGSANIAPGGQAHGAAGGAWQIGQPGQGGHDSVPLNVGGQDIMVAPGEVVGVFNRHQIPEINDALSLKGYAGLKGFFQRNRRPNYMAMGGLVPGFDTGGYVYPVPGLSVERTDQGKDFGGSGPIAAIGPGVVLGGGDWGWEGGSGLTYKLTGGSRAGSIVYTEEDLQPLVGPGAILKAGEIIARATGGPSGIEMGWANASGTGPLTPYNGSADGTAMPGGQDFASFVLGLAHGILTGGTGLGLASQISAPGVSGKGPLADMVRAALKKVARAGNAYLGKIAPTMGSPVGGSLGTTAGLSGTEMQIVNQLASRFGWTGEVQDWVNVLNAESNGTLTDTNAGSGAYGLAQFINGPSEYYTYGGNPNTYAGQLLAMANYIKGRYGSPAGAWAHEQAFHWYGAGGLLPGFSGGGMPGARKPTDPRIARLLAHKGKKHPPKPKRPKGVGIPGGDLHTDVGAGGIPKALGGDLIGRDGPFPFDVSDYGTINSVLAAILGLDATPGGGVSGALTGGAAQGLAQDIQWYTGLWGSSLYPPSVPGASDTFGSYADPSSFVLTTDASGNTVPAYISPNLPGVIDELTQVTGWQQGIVTDVTGALGGSNALVPMIQKAISRRVGEAAKIRQRVQKNLRDIRAKRAKIQANLKQMADLQRKIKATQSQVARERKKKKPNKGQIGAWQRQIQGWTNQYLALEKDNFVIGGNGQKLLGEPLPESLSWSEIGKLESQNQHLVGAPNSIPSTLGGELGTLMSQLGVGAGGDTISTVIGTGSSATGLYDLLSTVQGWVSSIGGTGGDLATQGLQLSEYQAALTALDPSAMAKVLAAAVAGQAPTASTNPFTGSTAFAYNGQTFLAGMASGGMLGWPPYAGMFHLGGVVPGPPGQERMALVKSGETITPPPNQMGGLGGSSALQRALDKLEATICKHDETVRANTMATCANTDATSKLPASFTRAPAGHNPYSPGLASDSILHIGTGN